MPNGHHHLTREYGKHSYASRGTSDCKHGCGCWMGPTRSGGPLGLDPHGECPSNPIDCEPLDGNEDYELVVKRRIQWLVMKNRELKEVVARLEGDVEELRGKLLLATLEIDGSRKELTRLRSAAKAMAEALANEFGGTVEECLEAYGIGED